MKFIYGAMVPFFLMITASCGNSPNSSSSITVLNARMKVVGVSMKYTASAMKTSGYRTGSPARYRDISGSLAGFPNHFDANFSGPPDYIKINLQDIGYVTSSGKRMSAWQGGKQLVIDGSGSPDTSDINLSFSLGEGETITNVMAHFTSAGYIKGQITAVLNTNAADCFTNTYYTKSNYSYNPGNLTGGAQNWAYFTNAPSEETAVYFFTGTGVEEISFPIPSGSAVYTNLIIAVDIDRALRFYNGTAAAGSGHVPFGGLTNAAYFYCGELSDFIYLFFGNDLLVQGYQTELGLNSNNEGTSGWMMMIFDPGTNFICGSLFRDIDGGLVINYGPIINYTGSNIRYGMYGDPLSTSVYTLTNFAMQTVLSNIVSNAGWSCNYGFMNNQSGPAMFQLLFEK